MKKFRNSGWEYYDKVHAIMLNVGQHAFSRHLLLILTTMNFLISGFGRGDKCIHGER
jgi:hypothetical protein